MGYAVVIAAAAMMAVATGAVAQAKGPATPSSVPETSTQPGDEKASVVPPKQAAPTRYQMQCSPPRTVAEASACADQASANAATRANEINIIGGTLLLLSLGASAAALFFSARATRAAERQAVHAENATEVTLRAYLGIEKVDVLWTRDGKPNFLVWVKNSGQTPARYFELACMAGVTSLGAKLPVKPVEGPFVRWLQIGRDQVRSARIVPSNEGDVEEVQVAKTTMVIYVSGQLRYEDIFGKVWTEEFRAFKWSPSGEREKMSFAAIKDEAPGVELLDG